MAYKRGEHPSSLKNLEKGRFQKGRSGNPQGRPPKEFCISDITREQLGKPCSKDPSKTWARYLSDKWLDLACENIHAFKELMERLEGKVVFPVAMETPPVVRWQIGKGYVGVDAGELEGQREIGTAEITKKEH